MKLSTLLLLGSAALALPFVVNAEPQQGGPKGNRPPKEAVLKRFDKDGDGKLSDAEKAEAKKAREAHQGEGGPRSEMREKAIKQFDADGDGKLNETEKAAAKAAAKTRMLERFDKDGDGTLSEEERAAARAAHPKHGGPRGDGPPPAPAE